MSLCRWMKKFEQKLLNHLQEDTISNDVPLKNVREGLGSIAYVTGNPKTKTEITINIDTFIWDITGGAILAPAALPAAAQTSFPVFLFGLTDYYGGYNRSANLLPVQPAWVYFNNAAGFSPIGIWGLNLSAVGNAYFLANIQRGDMIFLFNYFVVGVNNIYAMVRVRCQNVSYGTFLNSFVSDLITIDTIRYIVPIANVAQLINPVIFAVQTLFGKVKVDSIDPRMYITNKDFQQQIADIPINLPIDKSLIIGFQVSVFCQNISWVLFVNKVEPLTHR
jgi:hypothetical protein